MRLCGTVTKIFATRPSWSAGVLDVGHYSERFSAPEALAKGATVEMFGRFGTGKYGRQFDADRVVVLSDGGPSRYSTEGLVNYLAESEEFPQVGPQRARELVELFGGVDGLSRALLETPERIVGNVAGLTTDRVAVLAENWGVDYQIHVHRAQLMGVFGLREYEARRIIRALGPDALAILDENPWELYLRVPSLGFDRVDRLAEHSSATVDSPHRAHAQLVARARSEALSGHTWTPVSGGHLALLEEYDSRFLCLADVENGITGMSLRTHFLAEDKIDLALGELDSPSRFWAGRKDLPAPPETLTGGQRLAFERILDRHGMLLTGAAGTGKTYVANAIASAFEDAGGTVALAAPTGKAAKRLAQSTGRVAETIHRLLGAQPHPSGLGFEFTAQIESDLLLIDEISMCDSELLADLFRHTSPDTSVVLMGDENQLPPVRAGNPLRDAIQQQLLPHVRLDQVLRQTGDLKRCCLGILEGKVPQNVDGVFEITATSPNAIIPAMGRILATLAADGYDAKNDVQVLVPMREGNVSVGTVNEILQTSYLRPPPFDFKLWEGSRLIQTKNNYKQGIMNGEIGTLVSLGREELAVNFDGHLVTIPVTDELESETKHRYGDLELAYALTVHKAQGSEYPVVIVLLDTPHVHMLHRGLLYTAVTRARERCYVVATKTALANAVHRVEIDERRTLLQGSMQ